MGGIETDDPIGHGRRRKARLAGSWPVRAGRAVSALDQVVIGRLSRIRAVLAEAGRLA